MMDYREVLRTRLKKATAQNAQYSMRAFARDISLSPSRLSDILNGKQGLSRRKALEVCEALSLCPEETQFFVDSVEALHSKVAERSKAAALRIAATVPEPATTQISNDAFRAIADWYHMAIIQLAELKSFEPTAAYVANAIGIEVEQAQEAIDRLIRLGIFVATPDGFTVRESYLAVGDGRSSEAIRHFHGGVVGLAEKSIEGQAPEQRDLSAIFIPIDSKDLPAIREDITLFRRNLGKIYSKAENKDSVYCLSVQCFRVGPQDV